MNKRLGALAIGVAAVAAAAGLFASTSSSAPTRASALRPSDICSNHRGPGLFCTVWLSATGPSPSSLTKVAGVGLVFENTDSVTHTVVFANGLCSLSVPPTPQTGTYSRGHCRHDSPFCVGTYAYTVDGKFPGTVVTAPVSRTVTLTARTHTIRRGTGLTLQGRVSWNAENPVGNDEQRFHVSVLARRDGRHPFEHIATARVRFGQENGTQLGWIRYGWKLELQPGVTSTYVAEVTTQQAGGCQVWANPRSRPLTVRIAG